MAARRLPTHNGGSVTLKAGPTVYVALTLGMLLSPALRRMDTAETMATR